MKIKEITEGIRDWWKFYQGYKDPMGYSNPDLKKNVRGTQQDYYNREIASLRQQGQDVDKLLLDPAEISEPTKQAIDKAYRSNPTAKNDTEALASLLSRELDDIEKEKETNKEKRKELYKLLNQEIRDLKSDLINNKIENSKEENVAFLVKGDIFSATTHCDLFLR